MVRDALHDQIVGADQNIQIVRLAGRDGLHRGLGRTGDSVFYTDIVDKGLHARADVSGIVGIFVACIVDAKARSDAVACEGDGVKIGRCHGAQHRHGNHAVVGVQVFGVNGLLDRCGSIPHGGIHSLHNACRGLPCAGGLRGGRGLGGRFLGGGGGSLGRSRLGGRYRSGLCIMLHPEPADTGAGRCQNKNEDQHQFTFALSASDLIAVGIKIGHGIAPDFP